MGCDELLSKSTFMVFFPMRTGWWSFVTRIYSTHLDKSENVPHCGVQLNSDYLNWKKKKKKLTQRGSAWVQLSSEMQPVTKPSKPLPYSSCKLNTQTWDRYHFFTSLSETKPIRLSINVLKFSFQCTENVLHVLFGLLSWPIKVSFLHEKASSELSLPSNIKEPSTVFNSL